MFKYYFALGLRSLRRNPALTALMVLTLAIGVAASVSTLTILHVMSGDPIPHKSDRLLVPVFDVAPVAGWIPGELPDDVQMSYPDAVNLLKGKHGERRTAIFGIPAAIEPQRKDIGVFQANGLAPGYFATDMNRALVEDQVFSEWLCKRTPAGRWGKVEELCGAAVFLASGASDFINGQILYVDGGLTSVV